MHLIHFSFQKASYNFLTDQSCTMHGRLLYGIVEASIHVHIFLAKILTTDHTKNIQLMISRCRCYKFFCHSGDVMVISTCHTLVTGYHYGRYLTFFLWDQMTHAEERMLDIRNMTKNSGNRPLHIIEVRLCIRQYLLGFFHLGRGNHIHGIGNLHCVLDTAYPAFYFSCICHKFLLCNLCFILRLHDP